MTRLFHRKITRWRGCGPPTNIHLHTDKIIVDFQKLNLTMYFALIEILLSYVQQSSSENYKIYSSSLILKDLHRKKVFCQN